MEFDTEGFGKRLKHYRLQNHLTQEKLAEKIDTATSSISHLENGTHSPSLMTLIRLCGVLQIGVDDLLADSLPVRDVHLDKDLADLFHDCTADEKKILLDIISAAKTSLKKYRKA